MRISYMLSRLYLQAFTNRRRRYFERQSQRITLRRRAVLNVHYVSSVRKDAIVPLRKKNETRTVVIAVIVLIVFLLIRRENHVMLKAPMGRSYFRPKMSSLPTASQFGREVRRRKLKLDDQNSLVNCAPLKLWAKTHRHHNYVPEWLLSAWPMPVFEKDVRASRHD